MTLEERLNKLLEEKEEEISNLKAIADNLRVRLDGSATGWCMAYEDEGPDTKEHPLPRLEIVWQRDKDYGWSSFRTEYRLVAQHLSGSVVVYPLGFTKHNKGNGESPFDQNYARPGEPYLPDMPWRMGCEAVHDAHHLGLPLYAVTPKGYLRIDDHPTYKTQQNLGLEHRKLP